MSITQKVAVNTGVILLGRAADLLVRLVPVILMTRYLGGDGYGEYTYILTFVTFFGIFIDLGLDTILVRETSKDASDMGRVVGNVIIMKFLLSILTVALVLSGAFIMNVSGSKFEGIAIASLILLFGAYKIPLDSYFRINLKMLYSILATVAGSVVFAVAVLLTIFFRGNTLQFLAAYALSYAVDFIVTLSFSLRFVRPVLRVDFKLWKHLVRSALPLGLAEIFVAAYGKLGILVLSWMQGDAAVGYFAAPFGLVYKLEIIPWALNISLLPVFSQYYARNKLAWERATQLNLKYLLIICIPLAVFVAVFSGQIIYLIFGAKFGPSAAVLSILIWSKLFVFLNYQLNRAIISAGRQMLFTKAVGIMAALNILLSLVLIPNYSYIGASYATLLTEASGTFLLFYFLASSTRMPLQVPLYMKLAAITAVVYIFVLFASPGIWLAFPLMLSLYTVLLFASGVVDGEDISFIRKTVRWPLDSPGKREEVLK